MVTPSLYEPAELALMTQRIRSLRADSPRQWGRMEVAQMLAHGQVALRVALGDQQLKRGLVGLIFGPFARRQLLKPGQFGRNMPTAPEFKVSGVPDFEKERARLLALVERFGRGGPDGVTKEPHPFFGALTPADWNTLQWKHLDHHLRQFGV
jgi:hypothetical protein